VRTGATPATCAGEPVAHGSPGLPGCAATVGVRATSVTATGVSRAAATATATGYHEELEADAAEIPVDRQAAGHVRCAATPAATDAAVDAATSASIDASVPAARCAGARVSASPTNGDVQRCARRDIETCLDARAVASLAPIPVPPIDRVPDPPRPPTATTCICLTPAGTTNVWPLPEYKNPHTTAVEFCVQFDGNAARATSVASPEPTSRTPRPITKRQRPLCPKATSILNGASAGRRRFAILTRAIHPHKQLRRSFAEPQSRREDGHRL
jgi:hypothetical protein